MALCANIASDKDAATQYNTLAGAKTPTPNTSVDVAAEILKAGAEPATSLDAALALAGDVDRICVIGGAQIYALALPHADELLLTEIDADFDADAYFPDWPRDEFAEISSESNATENGLVYRYVTYRRKAQP